MLWEAFCLVSMALETWNLLSIFSNNLIKENSRFVFFFLPCDAALSFAFTTIICGNKATTTCYLARPLLCANMCSMTLWMRAWIIYEKSCITKSIFSLLPTCLPLATFLHLNLIFVRLFAFVLHKRFGLTGELVVIFGIACKICEFFSKSISMFSSTFLSSFVYAQLHCTLQV